MNIAQTIIRNRQWTTRQLRALGFTVLDSKANFLFAKSDRIPGGELYRGLKQRGVLVRHFAKAPIDPFVRITVGTMAQMEILIAKIQEMLGG